ncbi:PD-(D/E)XK nuclease-like domain-containing protein [Breoghania sp.]|uniref:PD-(D/E)XK nuclease-like domain-containing protein n=1 Tax=Breoghania sp. TaxID=2065378 RepID=UPI002AA8E4A1|nr:PD-(D/E)XK nuclease-like domain-containing protein [Breoghania sp.]
MSATVPLIVEGLPNEKYHAGKGVSKSGLWTIETRSPAHFRFQKEVKKPHFDVGEAIHLAILEPDKFESDVLRGPDDRRGNKWRDAEAYATNEKRLLLTGGDFDKALEVRDSVHADNWLNQVITGGERLVEASGYWIHPDTGSLCRCRPDLYRRDLSIILDIKSTQSAHPEAFARSVVNYGYHSQEALYTDGWRACGERVEGFIFLAFEKDFPLANRAYELPPSIVEEGRAIMHKALATYADCEKTDTWPAYGSGVEELKFKRWAYQNIQAPEALDSETA